MRASPTRRLTWPEPGCWASPPNSAWSSRTRPRAWHRVAPPAALSWGPPSPTKSNTSNAPAISSATSAAWPFPWRPRVWLCDLCRSNDNPTSSLTPALLIRLNPPPVPVLQRPRIDPVQHRESPQLRSADAHRLFEDEPAHALRTRRRRERAHVGPVAAVGRQKPARIDHVADLLGRAGRRGKIRPQGRQRGVRISRILAEPNGHHRQLSVGALVHQVRVHVSQLAIHRFFPGMVKVELLEVVPHPVGEDVAARPDIDPHGVARIFKLYRRRQVVEFDRLQRLVQLGPADVDRRLFLALRAQPVGRIKVAPTKRPGLAIVVPVRAALGRPGRPDSNRE